MFQTWNATKETLLLLYIIIYFILPTIFWSMNRFCFAYFLCLYVLYTPIISSIRTSFLIHCLWVTSYTLYMSIGKSRTTTYSCKYTTSQSGGMTRLMEPNKLVWVFQKLLVHKEWCIYQTNKKIHPMSSGLGRTED